MVFPEMQMGRVDGHKLPLVRPLDVLELDLKSPLDSPS